MNLTDWSGPTLIAVSLLCAAISAAGVLALAWLALDNDRRRPVSAARPTVRVVGEGSE